MRINSRSIVIQVGLPRSKSPSFGALILNKWESATGGLGHQQCNAYVGGRTVRLVTLNVQDTDGSEISSRYRSGLAHPEGALPNSWRIRGLGFFGRLSVIFLFGLASATFRDNFVSGELLARTN